jgi:hypothetical protein
MQVKVVRIGGAGWLRRGRGWREKHEDAKARNNEQRESREKTIPPLNVPMKIDQCIAFGTEAMGAGGCGYAE